MKRVKIALLNSYQARNGEFEKTYRQQAEEMGMKIEFFSEEYNKDGQEVDLAKKMAIFKPRLIITNFSEGDYFRIIHLIKKIQKGKQTRGILIIVCSLLINDSPLGRKSKENLLNLPGVAGAYPYRPSRKPLPSLAELLKLKQKRR